MNMSFTIGDITVQKPRFKTFINIVLGNVINAMIANEHNFFDAHNCELPCPLRCFIIPVMTKD